MCFSRTDRCHCSEPPLLPPKSAHFFFHLFFQLGIPGPFYSSIWVPHAVGSVASDGWLTRYLLEIMMQMDFEYILITLCGITDVFVVNCWRNVVRLQWRMVYECSVSPFGAVAEILRIFYSPSSPCMPCRCNGIFVRTNIWYCPSGFSRFIWLCNAPVDVQMSTSSIRRLKDWTYPVRWGFHSFQ